VGKYEDSLEAANLDQEGKKRLAEVKAYMDEERKKYLEVLKHWI
jgi:predicted ribonuclease toxin of YeeF-YezG toxin-antitoxin module